MKSPCQRSGVLSENASQCHPFDAVAGESNHQYTPLPRESRTVLKIAFLSFDKPIKCLGELPHTRTVTSDQHSYISDLEVY